MKKAHKTLTAIASLALAASLAASLAGCGGKAQDYVFEAEKAELSAACMVETGPEYSAEGSGPEATQVGYFTTAGETITFKINASKACSATLTLRASSACGQWAEPMVFEEVDMSKGEHAKLTVNGEEITKPSPERGMVFQKPTLFPWLTVEKNISFSLRMQGKYKGNEERVARMLRLIGLEEFKDDYPGQLSGGMAQRVALVRTLINQPDILLLDEPLGALDAFTRMNMQDEILAMWRSRRQLAVMVTHDVDEAIYMGSRVLVMAASPGRIKADIPIGLPSPRVRSSDAFIEYRKQIMDLLDYGRRE